jgi:Type I restriction enzyme R protein N terminus (HSDR_N)
MQRPGGDQVQPVIDARAVSAMTDQARFRAWQNLRHGINPENLEELMYPALNSRGRPGLAKPVQTLIEFVSLTAVPVGAIPDGKVVDFLSGHLLKDTAEEYVRQNIEKALVRQYKYAAADCEPEFRVRMGSAKLRVDIIIFHVGEANE